MRFDEIDFEDEVLDGLYDMNFEEMTPVRLLMLLMMSCSMCLKRLINTQIP